MSRIETQALRQALGRFATGVTVITTLGPDGRPVGLTANSLVRLSLEPPLLAWSLARRSGSLAAFLAAPWFAVNVLAEGQEALARRFAGPAERRFAELSWQAGLGGCPLLAESLASFECRSERRIETGDHWLLIGTPERLGHGPGAPLVFYASRFGLGPATADAAVPAAA